MLVMLVCIVEIKYTLFMPLLFTPVLQSISNRLTLCFSLEHVEIAYKISSEWELESETLFAIKLSKSSQKIMQLTYSMFIEKAYIG